MTVLKMINKILILLINEQALYLLHFIDIQKKTTWMDMNKGRKQKLNQNKWKKK